MAADNKTLGRFQLTNIPLAPRGVPQIEVSFDIDANGIVSVSAKDLGTQKSQSIVIQNSSSLSKEEIDKMIKEAEENASKDEAKKQEIDLRNESENIIFTAKKSMEDLGDEVTDSEKTDINEKINHLEDALKGNDIEDIKAKKEELVKASQSIAVKAYQKTQGKNSETTENQSNSVNPDDVVDADYTDK
jgi:molecular chaperone DnaK